MHASRNGSYTQGESAAEGEKNRAGAAGKGERELTGVVPLDRSVC